VQAAGIDGGRQAAAHGGEQLRIAVDAEDFAVGGRLLEDGGGVAAAVDGGIDAAGAGLEPQEVEQHGRQDRDVDGGVHGVSPSARPSRTGQLGGCAYSEAISSGSRARVYIWKFVMLLFAPSFPGAFPAPRKSGGDEPMFSSPS